MFSLLSVWDVLLPETLVFLARVSSYNCLWSMVRAAITKSRSQIYLRWPFVDLVSVCWDFRWMAYNSSFSFATLDADLLVVFFTAGVDFCASLGAKETENSSISLAEYNRWFCFNGRAVNYIYKDVVRLLAVIPIQATLAKDLAYLEIHICSRYWGRIISKRLLLFISGQAVLMVAILLTCKKFSWGTLAIEER